ncbi:MAG: response regulator [Pseudomonadota bacterium]
MFGWAAALAVAAAMIFLFIKSGGVDSRADMETRKNLGRVEELDALFNQRILQLRNSDVFNYDQVNLLAEAVRLHIGRLGSGKAALGRFGNAHIDNALWALSKEFTRKEETLEEFKKNHSSLRSSMLYFPRAVDKALLQMRVGSPLYEEVQGVEQDLLRVYMGNRETDRNEVKGRLKHLGDAAVKLPYPLRADLENVVWHGEVILRQVDSVNALLVMLTGDHIRNLTRNMSLAYNRQHDQLAQRASTARMLLLGIALALFAYAVYSFQRLRAKTAALGEAMTELENQKFALDQHDIVSVSDVAGNIIYVNDRFCEISGYSREELLGQNHRIIKSDHHPQEYFREMWRTIASGRVWHGEIKNRAKDGSHYWVNATMVPFLNKRGKPYRYISMRTDITENKRVEEALRVATVAAEAANQAKSDFLANMSHEIRTPMNGIIGMTDLLLETEMNTEQRELLGIVKSSADGLLAIINDILDFSKIEAGKMTIETIPFSLRHCVAETLKPLAFRAHAKKLELIGSIDPEVPDALLGDPGRVRQILINLVGNALKFTQHGEVEVAVDTVAVAGDDVWLHFAVRDTGIGIPAEKQKSIFEAFSQADTSTTRKYGGTGLGLTICNRLVEMMGGHITVESAPEQGSIFHFTVRLRLNHDAQPAMAPPVGVEGLRVLVVDDNAANRKVLEMILAHWKMRVATADGADAVPAMLHHAQTDGDPFRLLLLDACMPGKDGFALAAEVKQAQGLLQPKMVMLTSFGQRGDAARCREIGIDGYLVKPVSEFNLAEAVLAVLGQPDGADASLLVTRHSVEENLRPLAILLAEDNEVNQMLAVRVLEKMGHAVTVASNGKEALAALDQKNYDIVLMDMQMPEMDGAEAAQAIRAREQGSEAHLPIIALTAHAMSGDRERCLAVGMDGYVSKPLQPTELLNEMRRVLGQAVPAPAGSGVPQAAVPVVAAGAAASQPAPEEAPVGEVFAVFDYGEALARMGDSVELLQEIVKMFIEHHQQYIQDIRDAIASGDAYRVERAAHTLKGTVGNLSAHAAFAAARKLEQTGRMAALDQVPEEFAALEREMTRLLPVLEALLASPVDVKAEVVR